MRSQTISILAWLAIPALIACGDSSGSTAFDVSGDFRENFDCVPTAGMPFSDTVDMTLTQDGSDVMREDDNGTMWTGTISGMVVSLTTMGPNNYVENSTLTFESDADSFSVASAYMSDTTSGACTGSGERI
jgi:hypothetical protein